MLFLTTTTLVLAQHVLITFALPPTRRLAMAPAQYTANPKIGGGGSTYRDSAHFRVYNTTSTSIADSTLKILEAAHQCFVEELGWRTPGLSIKTGGIGKEVGPWYKTNIYSVQPSFMPGAAGQQGTDGNAGLAYLNIVHEYVTNAAVVVHEFGHSMHYSEKNWVNQERYVGLIIPIVYSINETSIGRVHGGNPSQTSSLTFTSQRPPAIRPSQQLIYPLPATVISIYRK
jgi:hypothetical protein